MSTALLGALLSLLGALLTHKITSFFSKKTKDKEYADNKLKDFNNKRNHGKGMIKTLCGKLAFLEDFETNNNKSIINKYDNELSEIIKLTIKHGNKISDLEKIEKKYLNKQKGFSFETIFGSRNYKNNIFINVNIQIKNIDIKEAKNIKIERTIHKNCEKIKTLPNGIMSSIDSKIIEIAPRDEDENISLLLDEEIKIFLQIKYDFEGDKFMQILEIPYFHLFDQINENFPRQKKLKEEIKNLNKEKSKWEPRLISEDLYNGVRLWS